MKITLYLHYFITSYSFILSGLASSFKSFCYDMYILFFLFNESCNVYFRFWFFVCLFVCLVHLFVSFFATRSVCGNSWARDWTYAIAATRATAVRTQKSQPARPSENSYTCILLNKLPVLFLSEPLTKNNRIYGEIRVKCILTDPSKVMQLCNQRINNNNNKIIIAPWKET